MKFTIAITDYIKSLSYDRLPPEAIKAGKTAILDCLGVALAGCNEIAGKLISDFVKGNKAEAGVIGSGFKTTADQAAWANGTIGHAIDYDDYFALDGSTPYHPTVAILPAVLAVGEKYHLSGKDVLLAYIIGFEVEAQIAKTCIEDQYDLGWHTTSTLGSMGAAAAVVKMLNLDEEKTRMALGIAASFSGGLRRNFGTMTKPLHAGNAARNGVVAGELAKNGYTADSEILDGKMSLGQVLSGNKDSSPKTFVRSSRTEFYILSPGIAFKPYPSCAYTHWAIDAALALRKKAHFDIADIEEIECRTSAGLPRILIHSRPLNALEGKFSLEYCVAAALIDGEVGLKQFTDEMVKRPVVQELLKKVRYAHPQELGTGLTNLRGEIVITLRGGESLQYKADIAKGDPRNPLRWQEMEKKYRDCVREILPPVNIDEFLSMISHLESVKDISDMMKITTYTSNDVRR